MVVVVAEFAHLGGIFAQCRFHPRILIDDGVLRVVITRAELLRRKNLFHGIQRASTHAREIFALQPNGKCCVGVLAQECAVVGRLAGWREAFEHIDIALAQTHFGRTIPAGQLHGFAGVHRRGAKTVLGDEIFFAHAGQFFVGTHALAHGFVVGRDVFKPLRPHAFGYARFNPLHILDKLLGSQAEFLPTWAGRLGQNSSPADSCRDQGNSKF